MKKYLLVVLCALLLVTVTGCGSKKEKGENGGNGGNNNPAKNQVVCTATGEENGIKMTAEVIGEFDNDNKLTDAKVSYDLSDETVAQQYCSLFKLMEDTEKGVTVNCSGTKITINGYANMESDDEDDKVLKGISKDEFISYIKSSDEATYTCK